MRRNHDVQARSTLLNSVDLYRMAIEKGNSMRDKSDSDIWKIRLVELLKYTGLALIGLDPYGISTHPWIAGSQKKIQDVKEVRKHVEKIIDSSKQRSKACETLIAKL